MTAKGFEVIIVADAEAAKRKALELIPAASEGFTMSSVTVDSIGLSAAVNESGNYDSVRASLTGSQIPAYAYGAPTVIFVVSVKKIVPTLDDAWRRLQDHVLSQESKRARKAYGLPESFNSFPSKVLVFNREVQPGRVKIILMNEDLGF